ncbi:MAG TPA: winged helix-turn-helix domain-containing protein [Dehalococcoidia bacterium]|nr:winged helix-turn-helix domain-containing protein [Dehalococcoidia bacterium]
MQAARTPTPLTAETMLQVGNLALDAEGYAVSVAGNDVFLTVSEFLLLRELARQPYRVIERAALWAVVQPGEAAAAPDAETLRAVDRHVARLRKKLRAAGFDGIQTMRSVGYRLTPAATPASGRTTPGQRRRGRGAR